MKRIATAVLLASLAVPAFAAETDAKGSTTDQSAATGASTAQTRRQATDATGMNFTEATGPWANDWNFIAPAQ